MCKSCAKASSFFSVDGMLITNAPQKSLRSFAGHNIFGLALRSSNSSSSRIQLWWSWWESRHGRVNFSSLLNSITKNTHEPLAHEYFLVELVGVEPTWRKSASQISHDSLSWIFVRRDKGQTKNLVSLSFGFRELRQAAQFLTLLIDASVLVEGVGGETTSEV